jgi:hypothetical protein
MKKLIPLLAGTLFLFWLMGFALRPVVKYSEKSQIKSNNQGSLNPALYPLILKYSDFKNTIKLLHRPIFTDHRKKIVFQFLYLDNSFTLGVFIGNKVQRGFDTVQNFILQPCTTCMPHYYIDNGVFLGDLEIEKQNKKSDSLEILAADNTIKYFVFNPSLVDTKDHKNKVVKYQIFIERIQETISESAINAATPSGIYTNPSPPRNGN